MLKHILYVYGKILLEAKLLNDLENISKMQSIFPNNLKNYETNIK